MYFAIFRISSRLPGMRASTCSTLLKVMAPATPRSKCVFCRAYSQLLALTCISRYRGRVIRELGIRRSDLIVTTKIFFGTKKNNPNDTGLSRKHIIEGTKASLERLGLDYVDVIFSHRPDPTVPIEEVVRAFNWVIEKGWAFYWATSEWSAHEIEEAYRGSDRLSARPSLILLL